MESEEPKKAKLVQINITPNASKKGLTEKLNVEAERVGLKLRYFTGDILEQALAARKDSKTNKSSNENIYDTALKSPLQAGGNHIQCMLSSEAKIEIGKWAAERKRALGAHCVFILEKWLEINSTENKDKN